MTKVLLLSDSHGYVDERILAYAAQADEVWHAGDLGTAEVLSVLERTAEVRAVYGNIDGADLRGRVPEFQSFDCEGVRVVMLHIGGYPEKYTAKAKALIAEEAPKLFISGHSHILKAMYDSKNALLHLNPGACGKVGWHKVRTMMRFEIDGEEIRNLEVIELGGR